MWHSIQASVILSLKDEITSFPWPKSKRWRNKKITYILRLAAVRKKKRKKAPFYEMKNLQSMGNYSKSMGVWNTMPSKV